MCTAEYVVVVDMFQKFGESSFFARRLQTENFCVCLNFVPFHPLARVLLLLAHAPLSRSSLLYGSLSGVFFVV